MPFLAFSCFVALDDCFYQKCCTVLYDTGYQLSLQQLCLHKDGIEQGCPVLSANGWTAAAFLSNQSGATEPLVQNLRCGLVGMITSSHSRCSVPGVAPDWLPLDNPSFEDPHLPSRVDFKVHAHFRCFR